MTALLDAGVNVVRINASHGTPEIRTRLGHASSRTVMEGRTRVGGGPDRPAGPAHPGR